jgi:hypothetical protein
MKLGAYFAVTGLGKIAQRTIAMLLRGDRVIHGIGGHQPITPEYRLSPFCALMFVTELLAVAKGWLQSNSSSASMMQITMGAELGKCTTSWRCAGSIAPCGPGEPALSLVGNWLIINFKLWVVICRVDRARNRG